MSVVVTSPGRKLLPVVRNHAKSAASPQHHGPGRAQWIWTSKELIGPVSCTQSSQFQREELYLLLDTLTCSKNLRKWGHWLLWAHRIFNLKGTLFRGHFLVTSVLRQHEYLAHDKSWAVYILSTESLFGVWEEMRTFVFHMAYRAQGVGRRSPKWALWLVWLVPAAPNQSLNLQWFFSMDKSSNLIIIVRKKMFLW